MIYDVRQVTAYSYASTVSRAHHVLRLTPIDRPRQRVQAAALEVVPRPVGRRELQDFFGNRVTSITIDQPHDILTIKVVSRVIVEDLEVPTPQTTPSWDSLREPVLATHNLGPGSPLHYMFGSRQVSLDPTISAYAAESFPRGCSVLAGALDLMARIKRDFIYEIGATTVATPPRIAFAGRRGVCQDFAHIMIAGLRGLGLPAAYVSGYLRTIRPGTPRLEGCDAMHAWVLVWCGDEAGWVGLDPTNAVVAGGDYIVLAIGRDYADIAPIVGVVFGSGAQRLSVSVGVTPVDEA